MPTKFELGPFREELSGLFAVAKQLAEKAEKRKVLLELFIAKIKDASKFTHQKLHSLQKGERKPKDSDAILFEFLEKISAESRTSYEAILAVSQRNKEWIFYLNELLKKIDSCFDRIAEKKEISYTERNLVRNNMRKLTQISAGAAKDDEFLEIVESDVMKTVDRLLLGLS